MSETTLARLGALLARRPLGLLTDIDGTISPIAPMPDAAEVDPGCRAALATLAERLELVAAITGRSASDAFRLIGLERMTLIGNHGFERWTPTGPVPLPEAAAYSARIAAAVRAAEAAIDLPGAIFENKGLTASVHYRMTADPAASREALRGVLEPIVAREGLVMTSGRMIWEVRPPISWDKGAAAAWLVEQHALAAAIFIGDDVTDVHGFVRLAAMRDAGQIDALLVGVVGPDTAAEVIAQSDIQVTGVAGVAALLEMLVALTA